jgi:hypothetical protein
LGPIWLSDPPADRPAHRLTLARGREQGQAGELTPPGPRLAPIGHPGWRRLGATTRTGAGQRALPGTDRLDGWSATAQFGQEPLPFPSRARGQGLDGDAREEDEAPAGQTDMPMADWHRRPPEVGRAETRVP